MKIVGYIIGALVGWLCGLLAAKLWIDDDGVRAVVFGIMTSSGAAIGVTIVQNRCSGS